MSQFQSGNKDIWTSICNTDESLRLLEWFRSKATWQTREQSSLFKIDFQCQTWLRSAHCGHNHRWSKVLWWNLFEIPVFALYLHGACNSFVHMWCTVQQANLRRVDWERWYCWRHTMPLMRFETRFWFLISIQLLKNSARTFPKVSCAHCCQSTASKHCFLSKKKALFSGLQKSLE